MMAAIANFDIEKAAKTNTLTFSDWLTYFWPLTCQLAKVSWHVIGQK
jgi:hypothetical protein